MTICKIVFAVLLIGLPSVANANDNISVIEQVGTQSIEASVTQTGTNTKNASTVKQDTTAKQSVIRQRGSNNQNNSSVTQSLPSRHSEVQSQLHKTELAITVTLS